MKLRAALLSCLLLAATGPARAEDREVPYWASLRGRDVNMRVGPGEDYRINFRYHREDLPMKVLRVMEGWRLVQDPDGARGWMLARFLKPQRGAIVKGERGGPPVDMRDKPDAAAKLLWKVEPDVTGKLGDCADGWCKFDVAGQVGYVREASLWGAGKP
jgi:SH3-like domain-containing protein